MKSLVIEMKDTCTSHCTTNSTFKQLLRFQYFVVNILVHTTTVITKKGDSSQSSDQSIVQVVTCMYLLRSTLFLLALNCCSYKLIFFFLRLTANNGEYLVLYDDHSLCYGRIGVDYMIQVIYIKMVSFSLTLLY